jgi:hypothetical protein
MHGQDLSACWGIASELITDGGKGQRAGGLRTKLRAFLPFYHSTLRGDSVFVFLIVAD